MSPKERAASLPPLTDAQVERIVRLLSLKGGGAA